MSRPSLLNAFIYLRFLSFSFSPLISIVSSPYCNAIIHEIVPILGCASSGISGNTTAGALPCIPNGNAVLKFYDLDPVSVVVFIHVLDNWTFLLYLLVVFNIL